MKVLVTGACGQIGTELVPILCEKYGKDNVIASDIKEELPEEISASKFVHLDILDKAGIEKIVNDEKINVIYHLAAVLSVKGEKNPKLAFSVNFIGLYNVLETAKDCAVNQVIVPSSIAVFGPSSPKYNTPNDTVLNPATIYGISKVYGELLGNYYYNKYGLDVRGVRFPGIISYKTLPGGGVTDYAVEIFYEAIKNKHYVFFVRPDTVLPMMYMPDAIKALIMLSEADSKKLTRRTDYNITAMSFSAKELADCIKKYINEFTCEYKPDFRQEIADSWPKTIDDSIARRDWGWKPDYDLESMVKDMIENLTKKLLKNY